MILHVFQRREAYFLTVFSLLLGILTIGIIDSLVPEELTDTMHNLLLGLGEAAILIPIILVLRQRHISIWRILPSSRIHPITLGVTLLFTAGMLIFIEWIDRLLIRYFPIPEFLEAMQQDLVWDSLGEAILLALAGVVIASIVEEIIFRGVLQQSILYSYRSHIPGLVIPTVIFALFHVQYMFYLPAALEVVILSFTLVYIVDRTGNIFLAMLSHALFNLTAFLSISNYDELGETPELLGAGWLIVGLILIAGSFLYLQRLPDVLKEDVQIIEAPSLEEDD